MADDYIGKKMEDYRRGVNASAYRRKTTPTGAPRGIWQVKFPPRTVFVTGGACGTGREIVRTLCQAGCRVAFCDTDTHAGTLTAQDTGSQFHPVDAADAEALDAALCRVIKSWGSLDVIVNNVGQTDAILATAKRMENYRSSLGQRPELSGRIINISYNGTSEGLTRPLTDTMTPLGVTVNCVVPKGENATGVAQTVTWLCSPGADCINGETIRVAAAE